MSDGIERLSIGEVVWDHGFTAPETAEHMYDWICSAPVSCPYGRSLVDQAQWRSAYQERFPYIRLYAPSADWFDDSYSLREVERIDFVDVKPPSGAVSNPDGGPEDPWI